MGRWTIAAFFVTMLGMHGAEAQTQKLVVLGYGGAFEKVFRGVLIPRFEKASGATVTYIPGRSEEIYARALVEAKQKTASIDVVFTSLVSQSAGNKAGVYAQLKMDLIPNARDLFPIAKQAPWGTYGLAYGLNAVVIGYRTDIFKTNSLPLPASWLDLKDGKYANWLGWYEPGGSVFPQVFDTYVRLLGEQGTYNFFKGMKKNIVNNYTSSGAENALQQGEIGIVPMLNGRLMVLKASGAPVGRVLPKEGGMASTSGIAIIKSSANVDLASRIINLALDPEIQALLSADAFLANTNDKAKIDPEAQKLLFTRAEIAAMKNSDLARIEQQSKKWAQFWEREINR